MATKKKLINVVEGLANMDELLAKAKKSAEEQAKRNNNSITKDLKKLKEIPNVAGFAQNALQVDDVIVFPKTVELMESMLSGIKFNNARNETLVCPVVVIRKGRTLSIPLYMSSFTRAIYEITAEATEDSEVKTTARYPEGQPADDIRQNNGYAVEAYCQFAGKFIRVSDSKELDCMLIKNPMTLIPGTNRYETEPGKRNLLTFEYIDGGTEME